MCRDIFCCSIKIVHGPFGIVGFRHARPFASKIKGRDRPSWLRGIYLPKAKSKHEDQHKPFSHVSKELSLSGLKTVPLPVWLFTCGSSPKYPQVRFINPNTASPTCQKQNMFLLNENR